MDCLIIFFRCKRHLLLCRIPRIVTVILMASINWHTKTLLCWTGKVLMFCWFYDIGNQGHLVYCGRRNVVHEYHLIILPACLFLHPNSLMVPLSADINAPLVLYVIIFVYLALYAWFTVYDVCGWGTRVWIHWCAVIKWKESWRDRLSVSLSVHEKSFWGTGRPSSIMYRLSLAICHNVPWLVRGRGDCHGK